MVASLGRCPGCGAELEHAPGIGRFCPRKECTRYDAVSHPQTEVERLKWGDVTPKE